MRPPRDTARGIIIHDERILLIERWRDDLHYFSVPGGGIEAGETPDVTVVRELAEETGCEVQVGREIYIQRMQDGTVHHIFLCTYISGEPHLPADSPEAQMPATNRFEPTWVPLSQIADTPFLVWAPIKEQLLRDLTQGFPETVQELALS